MEQPASSKKDSDNWNISMNPTVKDLLFGTISGICGGLIFGRVGKMSAAAITGGFFLVRVLEQKGYLAVEWEKITEDLQKSAKMLKKSENGLFPRVNAYLKAYKFFAVGFSSGFIIGLALN